MSDPVAFRPGDRVLLNSGGPPMTVEVADPDRGMLHCAWMAADGSLRSRAFRAVTVRPAPTAACP